MARGPWNIGDVVEDGYGNPAVVVATDHRGLPATVIQTVGSDRGRPASPGRILRRVEDERAEWARGIVRDMWASLPYYIRERAGREAARRRGQEA